MQFRQGVNRPFGAVSRVIQQVSTAPHPYSTVPSAAQTGLAQWQHEHKTGTAGADESYCVDAAS